MNIEERELFEVFKRNKFLLVKNFGHRRDIGDSPIMNLSRLYCDAVAIPFICVSSDIAISEEMTGPPAVVKIDFSTLRRVDLTTDVAKCTNEIDVSVYPSVEEYNDEGLLPRDDADAAVLSSGYKLNPIWNIPPKNLTISFGVRSDAVNFAKRISTLIDNSAFNDN